MQSYLDHIELLITSQFGYRPHLSTSRAVSNTLQFIYNNLDNGSVVVSIFLDFAKTIHCVNHEILLKKLIRYGIMVIASNWFLSYLSDRKKFLSLNGHNPEFCSFKSCVLQGSKLDPLLFLLFINDFPRCLIFFKVTLFADDSTLTCGFKNLYVENITNSINENFEKIYHWLDVNKTKEITHKSHHIVFSSRKKTFLPLTRLGREIIAQTEKKLGITLDGNLSFKM